MRCTWARRLGAAFEFSARAPSPVAKSTVSEDKLMEVALEAGADDLQAEDEGFEIYTKTLHLDAGELRRCARRWREQQSPP